MTAVSKPTIQELLFDWWTCPVTSVSKPTIQELLFDSGIDVAVAAVEMADADYALPDEGWIAGEFAQAFTPWRNQMVGAYASEDSDCDDFAECAAFFAKFLHRRTPDRPPDSALAFGEFWYQPTGGGHAINIAVCRSNEILRLVFFEPQTAQIVTLTQKEISSCIFLRM